MHVAQEGGAIFVENLILYPMKEVARLERAALRHPEEYKLLAESSYYLYRANFGLISQFGFLAF